MAAKKKKLHENVQLFKNFFIFSKKVCNIACSCCMGDSQIAYVLGSPFGGAVVKDD